jgi:hypothetical protein
VLFLRKKLFLFNADFETSNLFLETEASDVAFFIIPYIRVDFYAFSVNIGCGTVAVKSIDYDATFGVSVTLHKGDSACGNRRNCANRRRQVRYKPTPRIITNAGAPQTSVLICAMIFPIRFS